MHYWRCAGFSVVAIVSGAIFCGLAPAQAGDIVEPPASLMVAEPDAAPLARARPASSAAKTARKTPKAMRKAKTAPRAQIPASAAESGAPDKPVAASKPPAHDDGPVSLVGKWNGENETDFGPGTSLRAINQSIDSKLLGGSSQPVGAGAEVGVKYKF
jgi:hypothetical protein